VGRALRHRHVARATTEPRAAHREGRLGEVESDVRPCVRRILDVLSFGWLVPAWFAFDELLQLVRQSRPLDGATAGDVELLMCVAKCWFGLSLLYWPCAVVGSVRRRYAAHVQEAARDRAPARSNPSLGPGRDRR
jgi:hypothetical protein